MNRGLFPNFRAPAPWEDFDPSQRMVFVQVDVNK
jgi:hypothetical protein